MSFEITGLRVGEIKIPDSKIVGFWKTPFISVFGGFKTEKIKNE